MQGFVLIDLSYLIFHRYYAIVAWARLSKSDLLSNTDEFNNRFYTGFENFMTKLKKKLGLPNFNNVFFAKDTSRSMIWRNAVFPEYKTNRDEKSQDFDPAIFTHVHEVIVPELSKKLGVRVLAFPEAEADDIIAVSCKYIRSKHKSPIVILSNDNDFVQLHNLGIQIINANFINIVGRFTQEQLDVYVLWKVIKGDKSDNIPEIDKKIGDKVALKLATNPALLAKRIESSTKVADQYAINSTLIDFKNIPKNIQEGIEKLLEKMI
jgi:5'-3' exonuclease